MTFVQLYEEFKAQRTETDKSMIENEEEKFGRKKFIKMLKEMSKRLYPGIPTAYEMIVY